MLGVCVGRATAAVPISRLSRLESSLEAAAIVALQKWLSNTKAARKQAPMRRLYLETASAGTEAGMRRETCASCDPGCRSRQLWQLTIGCMFRRPQIACLVPSPQVKLSSSLLGISLQSRRNWAQSRRSCVQATRFSLTRAKRGAISLGLDTDAHITFLPCFHPLHL